MEFQYPVESDVEISYLISYYGATSSIIIHKGDTTVSKISDYFWMENLTDIIISITPQEDETYIYGL